MPAGVAPTPADDRPRAGLRSGPPTRRASSLEEARMIRRPLRSLSALLLALALALGLGPAFGQADDRASDEAQPPALEATPVESPPAAVPEGDAEALDPADLEAFLGGLVTAQLEARNIPGAVVTVVQDGEIVFARGYGWSDVEARTPVDPDATLFRIGSVSKLFTYTAAMQLVEQGLLDLEADVTTYLSELEIPATYDEPIRVWHLMTHTAGFEEHADDLFAREASAMRPLQEILAEQLPARVRPPGELAAYSNHGVGLLGLIVERVSGQSWEAYVEEHILAPLGMDGSTPRQPVPDALAANLSNGYLATPGGSDAQPFTFVPLGPAGGVSATGTDMARFMIAHLQDGRLGDVRILEEATAQRMHARRFGHDPRLPGMAHGFYEGVIDGQPTLGHDGGMPNFITRLLLLPERNIGVFVSYNSAGGALAQETLARAFVERYAPGDPPAPSAYQPSPAELRRAAGTYLTTRREETGPAKVGLLIQTLTVQQQEGRLRVTSLMQPPTTLEPVEAGLWRDVETGAPWGTDVRDGRPMLYAGNVPVMAFEGARWHQQPGLHYLLLGASLLLALSAVVLAPFGWVLHRRLGDRPPRLARAGRALLQLTSLLLVAFFVVMGVTLTNVESVLFGDTVVLDALAALLPVAAILAVVAAVLVVLAWLRGSWSVIGRIHATLVALAALVLVGELAYFNLLTVPGWLGG
jgi:CubicO group peptidase (beta-lactamase class C family)